MKRSVKPSQVSAFRLTRHHFVDQGRAKLTTVCQDVCGIQAQVMSAAQMALWARMRDLKREDIDSALWETRALVKTFSMRGTLHLLSVADFPIYVSALRRSRIEALLRIMSKFGITRKEVDRMNEAVVEALTFGSMTQRELTEQIKPAVGKKVRAWIERVWSPFGPATAEGLICYGPGRGQEVTFVRVDQWLPKQREVDEREAQQTLLRRYLAAYGPATVRDFSKWAGMPMAAGRAVWESLEDELVEVSIEEERGSILRQDERQLKKSSLNGPTLRLLPSFDPYMLAHADKDHLVDSSRYKRVYRQQGWISPVVLLDGKVIGVWSYTRRGKRLSLTVGRFEKFSGSIRAMIEEEAASLGEFLGFSWEITFSE